MYTKGTNEIPLGWRLILPNPFTLNNQNLVENLIREAHNILGYAGWQKTYIHLSKKYYWLGMTKGI